LFFVFVFSSSPATAGKLNIIFQVDCLTVAVASPVGTFFFLPCLSELQVNWIFVSLR